MKNTRRFIAGFSAMALAAAMAMSASAAEINQDSDPQEGSSTVTYNVDAAYTVTIPTTVTLSDTADVTDSVSASDVRLEKGKKIVVSLADTNTFKLAYENDDTVTLDYVVNKVEGEGDTKTTTPLDKGSEVAAFETDGTQNLSFALADGATPTYAGTYTGSLTFNIAVESAASAVLGGTWDYATISAINDNSVFTKDGVTLTTTSRSKSAGNFYDYGTNTFSVSSGKITKIEMISTYANLTAFPGATVVVDGKFYSTQDEMEKDCYKVTWTGNASEVAFRADIYAVEQITITVE